MAVRLFPVVMTVYFWKRLKRKRDAPSKYKAAETDATKPFSAPLLSMSLSLSLISPLVHASIFSDLCVNFFYGCPPSECPCLRKFFVWEEGYKCWMLSGKWRLHNWSLDVENIVETENVSLKTTRAFDERLARAAVAARRHRLQQCTSFSRFSFLILLFLHKRRKERHAARGPHSFLQ
jgi:hypothetical protein